MDSLNKRLLCELAQAGPLRTDDLARRVSARHWTDLCTALDELVSSGYATVVGPLGGPKLSIVFTPAAEPHSSSPDPAHEHVACEQARRCHGQVDCLSDSSLNTLLHVAAARIGFCLIRQLPASRSNKSSTTRLYVRPNAFLPQHETRKPDGRSARMHGRGELQQTRTRVISWVHRSNTSSRMLHADPVERFLVATLVQDRAAKCVPTVPGGELEPPTY